MPSHKEKIGRQIQLPLSKAVEITLKGLRNRLWRSIITMAGVILGIAFLMSIFTTDLVHRGLMQGGTPEIRYLLETQEAQSRAEQIWLVCLSLLVCVVGITNAMLMSVTERFREIGTMKCLGALDSLIRKLFFLEAIFQGLFGSLCGVVFGTVFVLLVSFVKYGAQAVTMLPLEPFVMRVAVALAVGIILSVVGAVFPASRAAAMAPAQAMATEV